MIPANVGAETLTHATPRRRVARKRRPLRIGYVLDRFPRTTHRFVLQEIVALQALNIHVDVFSLGGPEGRIDDTAMALGLIKGGVLCFSDENDAPGPWLAGHVAARNIDHLHAHSASTPTDVAREAARLAGIGHSFSAHAGRASDQMDVRCLRMKIEDAQFVRTFSDFHRGRLLRLCGPDIAGKIYRIPMGVDAGACAFRDPGLLDANAILAFGPLTLDFGVKSLIDAVGALRDRGRYICLTLVGHGRCDPALEAYIEQHRLGNRVNVEHDLSLADLLMLLRMHTALVLPDMTDYFDRDVLSTLALEAMACGVVVLSTDAGPMREIVDDGITGRLITGQDPLWLAASLDGLFDSQDLRRSLARRARARVEQQFTASRNVAQLGQLFLESVTGKRLD